MAFQPHRYTRTKELFDEFVTAFYNADVLIVTDIYAASEQTIEGVTSKALADAIRKHGQKDVTYIADRGEIPGHLIGVIRTGDIVMTLGAGNIWQTAEELLKRLEGSGKGPDVGKKRKAAGGKKLKIAE